MRRYHREIVRPRPQLAAVTCRAGPVLVGLVLGLLALGAGLRRGWPASGSSSSTEGRPPGGIRGTRDTQTAARLAGCATLYHQPDLVVYQIP